MPATTSPSSRSSPIESDQTDSPLSPSTRSGPKTPERKRDATHSARDSTPISVGTSILQKLRPDTENVAKYDSAKYEQYIAQDFEHHRVFVDIDVFMKNVLHVPDNWKELWGRTIRRIKRDRTFSTAHWDYSRQCGTQGVQEWRFYKPLVDMGNAILDFFGSSPDDCAKPQTPQCYLRNDPKRVLCGAMNDLSPDLVAVHHDFLSHLHPGESDEQRLKRSNLTWAQPLQVLEVKPWDSALVDGSCMPRLKANGRDPRQDHARPYTPSRFPKKKETSPDTNMHALDETVSAPELSLPRKRAAYEPPESSRKIAKVNHRSTPGGASGQVAERRLGQPQTNETENQRAAYLQVGRYLLEQFSIPAFRSHATIGLVDRDRIQFYHANHSVILVSSAINFSASDRTGGLDKFIAIVIAFGRLSLRDNGILHNLHDSKLFRDNGNLPTSKLARGAVRIQEGNKLEFGGDEKTRPFTLTYGEVISHEPSLAGRSTAVLHAKSSRWKRINLVVKISWPGSDRVAENEFLAKAVKTAKSTAANKWALNHLPRVLFAQDVVFDPDSTHERVASLFDNAEFVNEEYKYERRTLRIIIQERLYPLKTLTNVKDIVQVLLDIACIHRWLYVHAGILHRDLSLNNIMYRIIKEINEAGVTEERVCGVLTDFDLASWTNTLTRDYTKTSQQRTGTPPYMAHRLLDGTDALHLYRHEVESLFYIMLILAAHYEFKTPEEGKKGGLRTRDGELPYQRWFNQPLYNDLSSFKQTFLSDLEHLDLSPAFEDFRGWLEDLHLAFRRGIRSKQIHKENLMSLQRRRQGGRSKNEVTPTFDDETLGGYIHYSALIDPVRHLELEGKLKGLIIRYDPADD